MYMCMYMYSVRGASLDLLLAGWSHKELGTGYQGWVVGTVLVVLDSSVLCSGFSENLITLSSWQ